MCNYIDELINFTKLQASEFLVNAGEFFPFGTYVNADGEIIPCGAWIEDENDRPQSDGLIKLLEDYFNKHTATGKMKCAVIAVDVFLNKNGEKKDAIQMRFFEGTKRFTRYIKYVITHEDIIFSALE